MINITPKIPLYIPYIEFIFNILKIIKKKNNFIDTCKKKKNLKNKKKIKIKV